MDIIINDYYDKSFIAYLLCDLSHNYYSFVHQGIIFPTIILSSFLTIFNSSSIKEEYIKIINICINGINTVLLAVNSYFKFSDRAVHFNSMKIKFNDLNHRIESDKNKKLLNQDYNINIDEIIILFDKLYNDLEYQFPENVKSKIIKKYGNIRKLPNSLQIECETPKSSNIIITSF
jgi:hypothetical protein